MTVLKTSTRQNGYANVTWANKNAFGFSTVFSTYSSVSGLQNVVRQACLMFNGKIVYANFLFLNTVEHFYFLY